MWTPVMLHVVHPRHISARFGAGVAAANVCRAAANIGICKQQLLDFLMYMIYSELHI